MPIILACGATPTVVSQAPARDVSLNVTIHDQYAATAQVTVEVELLLAHHPGFYILSTAHTLTCNGIALPIARPDVKPQAQVSRQPPGGAYTFVYTDEQGQHTTLVVPVPRGAFAVTSPHEGAHIKVPQQLSYAATPTTTAIGTDGPGSTSAVSIPLTPAPIGQIRDPNLISQPPVVIRYTMPAFPTEGNATIQATAYCGRPGMSTCGIGVISGPTLDATGIYALTDASVPWGSGFETFSPGPGELVVNYAMGWTLAPGGFSAVRVAYADQAVLPVEWTR